MRTCLPHSRRLDAAGFLSRRLSVAEVNYLPQQYKIQRTFSNYTDCHRHSLSTEIIGGRKDFQNRTKVSDVVKGGSLCICSSVGIWNDVIVFDSAKLREYFDATQRHRVQTELSSTDEVALNATFFVAATYIGCLRVA